MPTELVDVTDLRWRWGQAIAQLPADVAGSDLDTFMRETVGEILAHVDDRNRLAGKLDALRALIEG